MPLPKLTNCATSVGAGRSVSDGGKTQAAQVLQAWQRARVNRASDHLAGASVSPHRAHLHGGREQASEPAGRQLPIRHGLVIHADPSPLRFIRPPFRRISADG
jgi:hypothetical protein